MLQPNCRNYCIIGKLYSVQNRPVTNQIAVLMMTIGLIELAMIDRDVRHRARPGVNLEEGRDATPEPAAMPIRGADANDSLPYSSDAPVVVSVEPYNPPPMAPPPHAEIYLQVVSEYQPHGIVEETWCRDIARNMHHALRLRLVRDGYLTAAETLLIHKVAKEAIKHENPQRFGNSEAEETSNLAQLVKMGRSRAGEAGLSEAYTAGLRKLSAIGFIPSDGFSRAYVDNMDKVEALEKLIILTDSRRDILIRELEQRRARPLPAPRRNGLVRSDDQ